MKLVKKFLAAAMAVCMVVALTACADTTWVFNYGGKVITSGVYLALSVSAYSEAASKTTDTETELLKQTIEEKPAKDWIVDRTKALCDRYIAVDNKFAEMGLTLTETDNNEIDQSMKVMWETYGPMFEENGVGQKSYRAVLENSKKSQLIFKAYYGTGGIEEITDDALTVHYRENFASVNMFSIYKIQPIGDEALTTEDETENEGLKLRAEEYAERINSGEITFNQAKDEYKHENEETSHDDEDTNDKIGDDKETRSLVRKTSTSPSEQVVKAVFEMKADGKATVLSDDKGYYVTMRYDVIEKPEDFQEMKDALLEDIKGDDFDKLVEEWGNSVAAATVNQPAVDRYNPKNIKM